jgi:hypothetical protein
MYYYRHLLDGYWQITFVARSLAWSEAAQECRVNRHQLRSKMAIEVATAFLYRINGAGIEERESDPGLPIVVLATKHPKELA